ncbi:carbohydrate ABC transporter permease [Tumebacillus permanentifrigoris]|uniref:Multiple sugar transport system permease protein n=1 Tax=Tumebacillus permanentifrigoris TaxID=378543 RepID=A0A316D456_9BACL|nr:sugar ABC transporter permease [Tumebacillus permanentifrigoris]PWK06589.1 multiple sugar transport system permease protein [Tumebacillus permanentifrigoris]
MKTSVPVEPNLQVSAARSPKKSRTFTMQSITPYLYIAPHLLFFLIFLVLPTGYGVYLSLHDWDLLRPAKFVGLENYYDIFFNKDSIDYSEFWNACWNTFKFVIFAVPVLILVPLLLAIAIDTKTWGSGFFRALFYAPSLLSVVTAVLIWVWMFDSNAGLVNYYLAKLGITGVAWLADLPWAWIALVIITVWWTIGRNLIIFLAGLNDIPDDLHEAAKLDGAGKVSRFLNVILPGLRGPMLFALVTTTIDSFNIFGQSMVATQGGPGTETKTLIMYIREAAFGSYRMGDAAAMAIVMGMFMLIVSVVQFGWINRDRSGRKRRTQAE